jgi:SAM-dependent methyltransferase
VSSCDRTNVPPTPDWDQGHYERVAEQLLPAAEVLIDRAAPAPGERVVDVGTGTGNAALLAAQRGATVVGVDPAARLLAVARDAAAARGHDAAFVEGEAAALPVLTGVADVVVSVFGVVFAPDAAAATAELARVTAPEGRVVLSAWLPTGPIAEMNRIARRAVAQALGAPAGAPPRVAWHDPDDLAVLLGPHGFAVEVSVHELAFTGPSPRAYLEAEQRSHPLAVGARAAVERSGGAAALFERMVAVLDEANEDPDAFRVTSRYVIATARR